MKWFRRKQESGMMVVMWCNLCQSEQATETIDVEINKQWLQLDVGPMCLTRMKDDGKIDM